MTQHTQPVVAGQHQQPQQPTPPQQQHQQQQTTMTSSTNNNNNNNMTPTSSNSSTNNNQTQTIAMQQQQQQQPNNNNYQQQQQQQNIATYNPQLHSANLYVPTHGMPPQAHPHHPHSHHPHHQTGAMYPTMIPAPIPPSNVYVNNVTANVNLHGGWAHTLPHGAWVHPGGAPHYIHGDMPPEQGAPVIQQMGGMPVTLPPGNALTGPLMNPNSAIMSSGPRGSRRGRGGRGGGSGGSRRGDYQIQRHPPPEGSPVPQQGVQTNQQDMQQQQQQQQQQSSDNQQMMATMQPTYVQHPQYATHAPQYPYGYPTYFAPQQHMIHPSQSAAAQQATGTPLYFSTMPVYNGHPMYNYGYLLPPVMNPNEYPYVQGEDIGGGGPVGAGDERQSAVEGGAAGGAMIWHQQPMYADEYAMNAGDMHSMSADDMNHNASSMGSADDTPTMLSPNYAPIYDPQLHEQMQQQMGVMQIYDDPQMGQIQVMHPQQGGGVPQMEDDLSECGSQVSQPIQIVSPGTIIATADPSMPMQATNEQIMHQHHAPHLMPVGPALGTGGAIMPIETEMAHNTTPQYQQNISGDNILDNTIQNYEQVGNIIQPSESVTSLNEQENLQQSTDNLALDYQQQQQHQQHQQQQNVYVEATVILQSDNNNKILMTDVQELQENVPKTIQTTPITPSAATTNTEVAVETTAAVINVASQQPTIYQEKQQQYVVPQQQQTNVKQSRVPELQQQQQFQHQQLQTLPPPPKTTQQQQAIPPQQQQYQPQQQQTQTHYQTAAQHTHQQHQQHQQQPQQHQQQHSYESRKSSNQMYNNQQQSQSRRKYDSYHSHGSNASNTSTDSSSNQQQHQQPQQQTTKTMSWTNSSQHKKSTNTVAVTATPSSSHSGNYNKQSNSSTTSASSSSHSHGTRTYTNQQHHNYQQQQQQQQQNYHYQQQPQTRNYGAMKMPSSPISSAPSTMERKISQSSDSGSKGHHHHQQQQQALTTSTASTTATPHQFQTPQTTNTDNVPVTTSTKQYPAGFANKKHSSSNTAQTAATSTTPAESVITPAINLAPPASTTTPAAPSTPSWASLFASNTTATSSTSTTNAGGNSGSTVNTPNTLPSTATTSSSSSGFSKKPIAKVAPYEGITPATPVAPIVTPGNMSYSAASAQNLPTPSASAAASSTVSRKVVTEQQQRNSLANLDEFSLKFADFLTKYKSDWSTVSLRPRGLTNRSNYCYINSILQALLGCSPLYNMIRSIPKQAANLCEVKTPTVNAMITFMSNFSNLPSGLRLRNAKGGKNNKDDLGGDLQCDTAFEPTEIYKLWNDSREEHVEGRQEDAEEFLSYILNKLNDEMLEVIKLISKPKPEQNGQNEQPEEEGDVWQMICNNRNKGSVTRQTDFGCTPLSDIFRGELRSRLQREGEHSTDVIQPFFTLQLNIEKAASVKEALEILVGRDQLEGVTGSKSKQEVVAWQQMNLEKLPPVLILHLKWFDYRSDGCTKIIKKVEFPVELKIDAKILASKKYSQKQRAYRLFAVVYHDGKEATKGHYITDVYHTGYGSWLRYDDSSVKPVSENHVLLPRTPRVPYLLCYRRCDTISQQQQQQQQQQNQSNASSSSSTGNTNTNNSSGNNTQSSGK